MGAIEKSLSTVKVDEKKLPVSEPHRTWALRNRQVRERDSMIYIALLSVPRDQFDAECNKQAERWGFKQVGRIKNIFDAYHTGEKSVVPHLAAQAEVHREFKKNEILQDAFNLRHELDSRLHELIVKRTDGEKWIEIEEYDGKIKRVSIDREIDRISGEILRSHGIEGDAMKQYMEKIPDKVEYFGSIDLVHKQADEDFRREFDRMIEADVEIMEQGEEN